MVRLATIIFCVVCVVWPISARAVAWTDAMGRSVEVAAQPQRVVSLVPSVTEILYALGVEDRLVGVTRFCTYPPQAAAKAQVGDYGNPNLEAVAALDPDLVILAADAANPAMLSRIEGLGVAAYIVYPKGIRETIATIRQLGLVLGVPQAGVKAALQLDRAIARIRSEVRGRVRPRVVFCVMTQPLVVAGPGTLIDDLIGLAGGRNMVPDGPNRYPTWGKESLLLVDPDVIIVSSHPGRLEPAALFADWPELWAVRKHQVVSIEPDWVSRPGPRLAQGAAALAEAFGRVEVNPAAGDRP
jgi:iron complex transport system substrate-binding protein